ncbi:hypothetical protein SONE68_0178 [Lacticaseibacillus paracasei]|nr:hypothetical protein [Lacticaseibacillus paracasei]BBF73028.1 hypothetical protein SONE68_0178 [Lacticaseibacillus paracasei]
MTVNQYAYTQRLTRSKKDPVRNYSSSDRILAGKAYLVAGELGNIPAT